MLVDLPFAGIHTMVHAIDDPDSVVGVAFGFMGEKYRGVVAGRNVQGEKNPPCGRTHGTAFGAEGGLEILLYRPGDFRQ